MKQISNDVFRVRFEERAIRETLRYTVSCVDNTLAKELPFYTLIEGKVLQDCVISACVIMQKKKMQRLLQLYQVGSI